MKSKIICKNCGKRGHHIRDCISPRCSYGIILYKKNGPLLELLMIRRRHTLGFVQFIRGQYACSNVEYITTLFNVMTDMEIDLIRTKDFDYLWNFLWYNTESQSSRMINNMKAAFKTFSALKQGIMTNDVTITIEYFIDKRYTSYTEQEWGFPKGKRNNYETDRQAAEREFSEETGIGLQDIILKKKTFVENYTSYDGVDYRNIYYLAECKTMDIKLNISKDKIEQITEISALRFIDINNCISYIRDYSKAKIKIIKNLKAYLK